MPQCMYIHTLGNSFPFAIWAQACLPQQLRPNTLSKEIGAVVDHPISFLSTYQVVGLVADHPTIFVRPLPSANDVRHMDQENCPPSATLMRNTTEHKVHTATCDPQPIRQKTLRTGRIPLGHCVPTHQSPPVDLQPKRQDSPRENPKGQKCTNTLNSASGPTAQEAGLTTGVGRRVCPHSHCSHLLPLELPHAKTVSKEQVQS
jgi:hypothetical protein